MPLALVKTAQAAINCVAKLAATSALLAMLANVAKPFAVSGMLGSTDYDLYVVTEDAGGNISAPPVRVQFSTALNTYAITVSVSPAGSGSASCDTNPVS